MKTFKTLEELSEYNSRAFQEVFGGVYRAPTPNPYEEGTWEALKFNARAHEVFNLDWSGYGSIDFGDRFLPYIKNGYKRKALWMYDGAELFKGLRRASSDKSFNFDDHKYMISLVSYTYHKGVLAQERKNLVRINDHEVVTFVEVDQNDTVDVHFKFGRRFKEHLRTVLKSAKKSQSITALEDKVYQTDVTTFKKFFKNQLLHHDMMRFVLNTLGIEKEATELANYNKSFSPKVLSYMDGFSILGKYDPTVFIEKSQSDVLRKTERPAEGKQIIFPKANEIYIWLVSEDYINYDTSFIKIQFGTNVAKDLKQREISKEFVEKLVLQQIKDELQLNVFSKKTIDKKVDRGLGEAMARLWIIEKLEESSLNREIFDTNPTLFLSLQAASFVINELEDLKFKEHNWNPRFPNYSPLIPGDTLFNATVCGLINGVIDEVKAIPEMAEFFSKIFGSEKEMQEFISGIKKLLDEGIVKTLIEGATEEYRKALRERNIEKLYYNFAHDIIQIISLLIGIFQLAKGISSFVNFSRKALKYIRRFGRKSIDDLKKLNTKQVKKVFDDLEEGSLSQRIKGYSSKFARKVKKSFDKAPMKVKDFEGLHTNSPTEFGQIYNPKTKIADVHTSNLADRISWPDRLRLKARNSVLTHNHPGGTGLSIADIKFFISNRLKEIRAVTPEGEVFSIKWKKPPNRDIYKEVTSKLREIEADFNLSRQFSVGDEAVSIKREFEAVYKALEDKIDYIHYVK